MKSPQAVEISEMGDPGHSVQVGTEGPVYSSSWLIVSYFSFIEDLRQVGTSGPKTLKKSVDW